MDTPTTLSLTPDEHRASRQSYAEQFDNLAQIDMKLAMAFAKIGADYRKLTINYLILGNGGGLAALVALYPLVKETNATWLTHQFDVAFIFGWGLFLGATAAACTQYNYFMASSIRFGASRITDLLLRKNEFRLDPKEVDPMIDHNRAVQAKQIKFLRRTDFAITCLTVASAAAWALGAYALVKRVAAA